MAQLILEGQGVRSHSVKVTEARRHKWGSVLNTNTTISNIETDEDVSRLYQSNIYIVCTFGEIAARREMTAGKGVSADRRQHLVAVTLQRETSFGCLPEGRPSVVLGIVGG